MIGTVCRRASTTVTFGAARPAGGSAGAEQPATPAATVAAEVESNNNSLMVGDAAGYVILCDLQNRRGSIDLGPSDGLEGKRVAPLEVMNHGRLTLAKGANRF
jgi:hypothetical protein